LQGHIVSTARGMNHTYFIAPLTPPTQNHNYTSVQLQCTTLALFYFVVVSWRVIWSRDWSSPGKQAKEEEEEERQQRENLFLWDSKPAPEVLHSSSASRQINQITEEEDEEEKFCIFACGD